MLAAEDRLARKALAGNEPDLQFSKTSHPLRRQRFVVERPRTQPVSFVEQRNYVAVPFNLEVVVRSAGPHERQVHEEIFATIAQHVVAAWPRIVASRDVRDRLQRLLG